MYLSDNQILLLKDNNYRGVYIASGMSGESYDLYNIYKLSNSSIEEIKKIIENHKYSEDTQNFTESTETNDENSNDFSAFFEYDYVLSYNNKTFKITKDEDDFKTLSEIIQKTIE